MQQFLQTRKKSIVSCVNVKTIVLKFDGKSVEYLKQKTRRCVRGRDSLREVADALRTGIDLSYIRFS